MHQLGSPPNSKKCGSIYTQSEDGNGTASLPLMVNSLAEGANPKRQIIACDTDIQALQQAVDDGVVSRSGELATLCPLADIIILAVPPLTVCELLPEILNCMAPSSLITDVASVK